MTMFKTLFAALTASILCFVQPAVADTIKQELGRAEQLFQMAGTLYQQGKHQEVIALLHQSLAIKEAVLGPDHHDIALVLTAMSFEYEILGQHGTAVPLLERALSINEKALGPENLVTATTLNNLALLYRTIGQYAKALPLFQRALTIQEKALGPEDAVTAATLDNLAGIYQMLGQYDRAEPIFQRALLIRDKVLGPGHPDTAITLNNLALLYKTLGLYDKALPLYQRALSAKEKNLGSDRSDRTIATTLDNLANLHQILGQYDKAQPLYQRALAIQERELGTEHFDTAITLNNLALLYRALGQYDKALPLLQRILAIAEKSLGPWHPDTGTILNNLANLYAMLGQYDKALLLYQRALAIREKALGLEHPATAQSMSNLAELYRTVDQNDKALSLFQRALAIQEKVLGPWHPDTALTLNNMALLHHALGQYDKALPLYRRALAIKERALGSQHPSTALTLNNLAEIHKSLDQYDKALPMLQRAYLALLSTREPDTLKLVQGNLSAYYATQDNPTASIFYLKAAVNTMQSIRAESRGLDRDFQKSLLNKNEGIYQRLADLLIEEGRLAEAQQVLSMLKEEEYFDFIRRDAKADARSTRMHYNGAEQPLADQLEKLGNAGAVLADQFNALNKQAKLGLTPEQEKQRAQIRAQLDEQARQTIALLEDIPQQLAATRQRTGQAQPLPSGRENLKQLRAMLTSLGNGAVLLQYLVTETRVRILLTTPETQLVRDAGIPVKELNRKISAFRRVLQNPARDPRPLAQELHKILFAPVADDLHQAQARTLMLALDGNLRYLPIAALHDGKAYLAERYPLAMYTEVAKEKLREKPDARWKAAGLGVTRKIGEFAPLPSVRQELGGIIRAGSGKATGGVLPGDIYLDQDFTQARFRTVLERDYPVLHIASHFVFIPGTEAQSFLLLGDGKQLSLADLRTGGWQFGSVDMMTLSACETALGGGQDENGREIEGFGALAQRQGAKGVLATLWPVADQSTAIFMQNLYRLRQEKGLTKAGALREAQLALLSGKHPLPATRKLPIASTGAATADAPAYTPDPARPYAHPYYWAPFILMGNWL